MTHRYRDLLSATDEELISTHDAIAGNTYAGVDFYLNELSRRDAARAGKRIEALTDAVKRLTVVITLLTMINCVAAIVAAVAAVVALQ